LRLSNKPFQVFKKSRVGLGDALGVFDFDTGLSQANQRKTHGHAMILVRANTGWTQGARLDFQAVVKLDDFGTQAADFSGQIADAVRFFVSNVRHIANACRTLSEKGDGRQRRYGITDGVHIHVDAV
jgi:hypothetical protein